MKFSYDRETDEMVVRFSADELQFADALFAIGVGSVRNDHPAFEQAVHFYNQHWQNQSHADAVETVPDNKRATEEESIEYMANMNMSLARYGLETTYYDDGSIPND